MTKADPVSDHKGVA